MEGRRGRAMQVRRVVGQKMLIESQILKFVSILVVTDVSPSDSKRQQ